MIRVEEWGCSLTHSRSERQRRGQSSTGIRASSFIAARSGINDSIPCAPNKRVALDARDLPKEKRSGWGGWVPCKGYPVSRRR